MLKRQNFEIGVPALQGQPSGIRQTPVIVSQLQAWGWVWCTAEPGSRNVSSCPFAAVSFVADVPSYRVRVTQVSSVAIPPSGSGWRGGDADDLVCMFEQCLLGTMLLLRIWAVGLVDAPKYFPSLRSGLHAGSRALVCV